MILESMTGLNSFGLTMERTMKKARGVLSSLLGGAVAALLLAAPAAMAQTTVSTYTINVSGSASAVKTGLPETVKFSGPLVVTTSVVSDPSLPPGVIVSVDGRGVTGVGQKTGTIYKNECEANLTRLFSATDTIKLTFAFFPAPGANAPADAVGAYMSSKTGILTLNLAYDTVTTALTGVTASVGTL